MSMYVRLSLYICTFISVPFVLVYENEEIELRKLVVYNSMKFYQHHQLPRITRM